MPVTWQPFNFLKQLLVPQSVPVLDVCAVLSNSMKRRRTILTVPWLVEFLSMLDFIGPLLLCYRTALGKLLLLYRSVSISAHLFYKHLIKKGTVPVKCQVNILLGYNNSFTYKRTLLMLFYAYSLPLNSEFFP